VPKGHKTSAWDHLIRRKSIITRAQAPQLLPDWLYAPDGVAETMKVVGALNPVVQWIARHI
jgi:hypothetical protein